MAGVRKKPTGGGQFQAWYFDHTGQRKYLTFPTSKEALRIAQRLEDDHRQIRLGYRPVPSSSEKHRSRAFTEVAAEYMDWGAAQGGRGGRPWSTMHRKHRRSQLSWWENTLGLGTLSDLDGILPRTEKALGTMLAGGRTGKTVAAYAETLQAFCNWCIDRGYLSENPLKSLTGFDTTPKTDRRMMTPEEMSRLLNIAPPARRLLYETAFASGLRANELRHLSITHLDSQRGGVLLDAAWTKNRKPGFQPLPYALVHQLEAFAESGEPRGLYVAAFRRGNAKRQPPTDPLLYVPSQPARTFVRDLEAAGIPKYNPMGKLDFHAARVCYINLLLQDGKITPKEVQELARHSTLDLTIGLYGRTDAERLRGAVERVGEAVLPREECVPSVYRMVVGAERESAIPSNTRDCALPNMAPAVGLEPTTWWLTATRSAS